MAKLNQIEQLLLLLNQAHYRKLMARLPREQFVALECWPSLPKKLRQQFYLWLFRLPLQSTTLAIKPDTSFNLTMGQLHYLFSGPLTIGYIIEIPYNYHNEITPTYISSIYGKPAAVLTDITELPNLEHLLNGPHLSIFALGNTQIIASINKQMADFVHA